MFWQSLVGCPSALALCFPEELTETQAMGRFERDGRKKAEAGEPHLGEGAEDGLS